MGEGQGGKVANIAMLVRKPLGKRSESTAAILNRQRVKSADDGGHFGYATFHPEDLFLW